MRAREIAALAVVSILLASCSGPRIAMLDNPPAPSLTVFFGVSSDVPHSRYEKWLLQKSLASAVRRATSWTVCIPSESEEDIAPTHSCVGPASEGNDSSIYVAVVITHLEGVSDSGNVFGGKLEGTGKIKALVTATSDEGKILSRCAAEADGASEEFAGLRLAKGMGRATQDMAALIVETLVEAVAHAPH